MPCLRGGGVIKTISIKEPWASLIIHGGVTGSGKRLWKNIENRDWLYACNHRGRLAIHSSKGKAGLADNIQYVRDNYDIDIDPATLTFGSILGSVEMIDCVHGSHPSIWFRGEWGFVLKDPFAYPKPLPAKGALGLWNPDKILARELEKYERLRLNKR